MNSAHSITPSDPEEVAVSNTVDALILDLLEWLGPHPRTRDLCAGVALRVPCLRSKRRDPGYGDRDWPRDTALDATAHRRRMVVMEATRSCEAT